MFIAIEGIEGSGKSTLLRALAERLRMEGHGVVATREPGGTPVGDAIRKIFLDRRQQIEPLAEALLVNAARAQHVADVIRPALAQGRIVLCDRFVDSTLAYQGYGRGLPLDTLQRLCEAATGGLGADLVLVVDVPVSVARSRMRERVENDRIESEDDAFHERIRRGFLELAHAPCHKVLDGMRPVDELVAEAVREL